MHVERQKYVYLLRKGAHVDQQRLYYIEISSSGTPLRGASYASVRRTGRVREGIQAYASPKKHPFITFYNSYTISHIGMCINFISAKRTIKR